MPATNEVLQDGRYKINHQFPINGDGVVFDAYDTVRDTKVLVKEIAVRMNRVTTASQQEQLKSTFANQAKLLTSVKHDTLINIHDYFSETGRQYLVMEALEGSELSDLISREGKPFPVESVVRWADQLLDGLHYLHIFEPSIVHKNIRPENIKLTADNRIKLLAFGLADGSDTRITTNVSCAADESEISYSPLEQLWDNLDSASQRVIADSYGEQEERVFRSPLDATSDIYSLGATLYHLLTGNKPVSALERSIEILDGNADPLPVPTSVNLAIPESVSKLLLTAMQVKRGDRFSSSAQMREMLRSVFPLNDLAKPEKSEVSVPVVPKQEVPIVAASPRQETRSATKETTRNASTVPKTVTEAIPAAPLDDFRSVLTVDHASADGTANYGAGTPTEETVEFVSVKTEEVENEPFTYGSEKKGSSVPMVAIAGGIALLIVVAIGVWFTMSSGSATSGPAVSTQTQLAAPLTEPAPTASQPEAVDPQAAVPSEELTVEASPAVEVPPTDQAGSSRDVAKPKPAKPAAVPAKAPAKKKELTVDDLIRDN